MTWRARCIVGIALSLLFGAATAAGVAWAFLRWGATSPPGTMRAWMRDEPWALVAITQAGRWGVRTQWVSEYYIVKDPDARLSQESMVRTVNAGREWIDEPPWPEWGKLHRPAHRILQAQQYAYGWPFPVAWSEEVPAGWSMYPG